jgi:hypothetical protein
MEILERMNIDDGFLDDDDEFEKIDLEQIDS